MDSVEDDVGWCGMSSSLGEMAGLKLETVLGRIGDENLADLKRGFEAVAVDGIWSKEVFLAWVREGRSRDFARENLLEFWFEMMSIDGGETVAVGDFLLAYATFCRGKNLEKNMLLFAALDKDGDGHLDAEEWEKLSETALLFSKWVGLSSSTKTTLAGTLDTTVFGSELISVSFCEYLRWAESELWMVQFVAFLTDFCRESSRRMKGSAKYQSDLKEPASFSLFSALSSSIESVSQDKVQICRSKTHSSSLDGGLNNSFFIDYDDLCMGCRIGSGKYSDVYRGEWLHQPVAIKVLRDSENEGWRTRSLLVREARIMSQLRHPNIMLYMGATIDPDAPLCLVSELFDGGALSSFLQEENKNDLSDKARSNIALAIARGMLYLHSSDPVVCHKDLKSDNILVSADGRRVVVSDFGLSQLHNPNALDEGLVGTPATMAPEVACGQSYTPAADVYSFGIVLYEIFTGRRAFHGLIAMQILFAVSQGKRPIFHETDSVPSTAQSLMESCWAADPQSRPTFDTIIRILKDLEQSL